LNFIDRGFAGHGTRILFYRKPEPLEADDNFQVWTVNAGSQQGGLLQMMAVGSNTDPDWQR
jgi:hypothetical protein